MGTRKERPRTEPKVASEPPQKEVDLEALMKELASVKEALECERKRSADYLDRLKYMQAELENLQKRTKKEAEEIIERANERLISRLLVIVDDMEIAVRALSKIENSQAARSGFELVLKKAREILEEEGLKRIEAVGCRFDPSIHEAANQIPREDTPDGHVVEELRPGYMFKGRVLRPSIVVVAKNPEENSLEEKRSE
ncbi:nucleotide exchange factor GrpE [Candidatus Bathyarchaeota archaeon]|nr:nucleotide exchange factor GrpE [Candidatus Bathyarchaeota archaeon]